MAKHNHATAIQRIGRRVLQDHFHIKRQAVYQWEYKGIPKIHLNSVRLLAMLRGVQVPELTDAD